MPGGQRSGAGRPAGSPNRRTAAQAEAAAASGLMPLDFLLSVMRDESLELGARIDAAHKAAPFVHPKLSNVQASLSHDAGDALADLLADIAQNGKRLTGA